MKSIISLFILAITCSLRVYSQCDCSELLKYGLYNNFSNTSRVENYSKVSSAISDLYNKAKSSGQGANASYGMFGGSYTQNQANSLYKLVTEDNFTENEGTAIINNSGSSISPEMVSAYKACLDLCKKSGLNFKANLPSDNLATNVVFTFTYNKPDWVKVVPRVKRIVILPSPDCFTCTGSLLDLIKDSLLINEYEPYSLTCVRNISPEKFKQIGSEDTYIRAVDALIQIETSMGFYTVRIPPIFAQTERTQRVGEIVASMLDTTKFFEINGRNNWMLADGSKVPDNCGYKNLIGETVPDLRGVFLRGKNHDRPRTEGNPEGDLSLGEFRKDTLMKHNHTVRAVTYVPGEGEMGNRAGFPVKNLESSFTGGDETRPRNVTVNYFIKIN